MKLSQLNDYADGKILAGVFDATGHIVINNPDRHNAVSKDMYEAAAEQAEAMASDDNVRLLMLRGAGEKPLPQVRIFQNLKKNAIARNRLQPIRQLPPDFYSSIFNFPKPTIAYIQGYCIGGGMALAVACDLRICEDKSRFAVPAAKLGLGYGFDGVARLNALVGPSMVKEIFFTARQFSAWEAYDMGLVNRVLPAHMLPAYAEDYSRRIAENAPLTVGSIKAITQDLQKPESERNLDRLAAMVKACFDSEDYKEGRRAFMEKRKPQFKGR